MPTFQTPAPISATIEFDVGIARLVATDRVDTVVHVAPTDEHVDRDVRAARDTKVSYENGVLLVKGPRKRATFGKPGSVEVTVELPTGSSLTSNTPMGEFTCVGGFGDLRLKSSVGDLRVERAASAHLSCQLGNVVLDHVTGDAEVSATGKITVGLVEGNTTVKNANGETDIREVRGDVHARTANGGITIGVAHGNVDAKTSFGSVRIADVRRGQVVAETAVGEVEVGIHAGSLAWLDVSAKLGQVRNEMTTTDAPEGDADKVEVHASTALGNITVRRA
jgi:hypothetical protein